MSKGLMSPWTQVNNSFYRRVGIIEATVFGVPDKRPVRYTWQLHVITGYFATGSGATPLEAINAADEELEKTVDRINAVWNRAARV